MLQTGMLRWVDSDKRLLLADVPIARCMVETTADLIHAIVMDTAEASIRSSRNPLCGTPVQLHQVQRLGTYYFVVVSTAVRGMLRGSFLGSGDA